METKEWENKEETISSSDKRIQNFLEKKYGKFKDSGGCSIFLTKSECKSILSIMEDNDLDRIGGMSICGTFGDKKVNYFELVGNKKLFLIEELYVEHRNVGDNKK